MAHVLADHVERQIGPGWVQWGTCEVVHGQRYTNTTLAAPANLGDPSVQLNAAPQVNDFLVIGSIAEAYQVTAVSGAGPYVAVLKGTIASNQAVNSPVYALWTVDCYINGLQNFTPAYGSNLTVGIRFCEGWNPQVGDVVPILRGPNGLESDRFVIRELAAGRGPGCSGFVGLAAGAPPSATPFGAGSVYVDPITPRLYICTVGSIQNSSGVVTTPAVWHYATLT